MSVNTNDKIFLLHIPKTAGVSFYSFLQDNVFIGRSSEEFNMYTFPEKVDINNITSHDLIGGHVDLVDVIDKLHGYKLVTILRHPVDRCISWYKYSKLVSSNKINEENNSIKLEHLHLSKHSMNQEYVHNTMTWMLGDHLQANRRTLSPKECLKNAKNNLTKFNDVLFFNKLKYDILDFIDKYGYDIDIDKLPWINPTVTMKVDITEKAVYNLMDCNDMDIELYDFAEKLFNKV